MGRADDGATEPWGIISVKAQSVDYELPMQPITMMRNALGKEEGGSGVGMDRDKYKESQARAAVEARAPRLLLSPLPRWGSLLLPRLPAYCLLTAC